MRSNHKCDFCGAPRLRSDNSCQFCGQIFEKNKKIKFTNIKLDKIKSGFTNKKNQFDNIRNSIDITFLKNFQDHLFVGFNDSYKRSLKLFKETEKEGREFISNNSKKIALIFIGLAFSLITIQLLTNYLNYLAEEEERIALENARAEEKKIAFDNRNKKDQYNKLAEEKFKNNDFEDALNNYYESLKIAPNYREHIWFIKSNNKALKGIAEIKILQGKYYDAIRNLSEIIDRGTNFNRKYGDQSESEISEIYYKRGLAYHSLKEYELAKNDFSSALSFVSTNPKPDKNYDFQENIYFLNGDSYLNIGNYQKAIENINVAIAKDNNKPDYLQIRARANYFLGKYDQSISDATKSLGLINKDNKAKSYSFFIRAESNVSNKNYKNACFDFEKAFELNDSRKNTTINTNFYRFNCLGIPTKDLYISKKISAEEPCAIEKVKEEIVSLGGMMVNSSFIGCWKKKGEKTNFTHIFMNQEKGELGIVASAFGKKEPIEYLIPYNISINKSCENCSGKTISASYYIETTNFKTIRKYKIRDKNTLIVDWEGIDRSSSSGTYILSRY